MLPLPLALSSSPSVSSNSPHSHASESEDEWNWCRSLENGSLKLDFKSSQPRVSVVSTLCLVLFVCLFVCFVYVLVYWCRLTRSNSFHGVWAQRQITVVRNKKEDRSKVCGRVREGCHTYTHTHSHFSSLITFCGRRTVLDRKQRPQVCFF